MSSRSRQARAGSIGLRLTSVAVLVFLYVPVVVLVVFSFNSARVGSKWENTTLEWYRSIASNRQLVEAIKNSLWIAVIATVVSTVLATMLALGTERTRFRGQRAAEQVMNLPIVTPEIVTGVSLLAAYSLAFRVLNDVFDRTPATAFRLGRPTILLAHIAFDTAFATLIVRTSLRNLDPALEEASRDLGATRWVTFWRVTLPAILPGVIGAALLAFTLSIDNFVITFFVAGPGSSTLPINIYGSMRRSISPEINAVSTLIFLTSVLFLLAALGAQAIAMRRSGPIPNTTTASNTTSNTTSNTN